VDGTAADVVTASPQELSAAAAQLVVPAATT
jgi:hypothetical protein